MWADSCARMENISEPEMTAMGMRLAEKKSAVAPRMATGAPYLTTGCCQRVGFASLAPFFGAGTWQPPPEHSLSEAAEAEGLRPAAARDMRPATGVGSEVDGALVLRSNAALSDEA
ncbi:MAG: hypothetical protein FD126_2301, partial [Elusimicrobia bacterium]